MYQNKHGNTASNRTEFTLHRRHTVDFTSGADLQHLGGYFISGDKVLYVRLTATHHLQSQKYTVMACALVVLLLLFLCLSSPLLHLSSIFCSSKHIPTEVPLVLLRGSAVPCAGVAPEPPGTSPVPHGAAPAAPQRPHSNTWDPQDPQHHFAPGTPLSATLTTTVTSARSPMKPPESHLPFTNSRKPNQPRKNANQSCICLSLSNGN